MIIPDLIQHSPDWIQMRKGMITGSMVADATAKMATQPKMTKKCSDGKHGACETGYCNCSCHGPKPGVLYQKCREDYMFDLAVTRLTNLMPERYVSKAMEFGTENEPRGRAAYEMHADVMVEEVGFAFHPTIKWYGSSPDGLVGSEGVLEIKCPNSSTHLEYLLGGEVPEKYLPQMKSHMLCAERQWCDFVSFDPRMPKHLQLFVRRLDRDEPMLLELEREVEKFLAELDEMMAKFDKVPKVVTSLNPIAEFSGIVP